MGNGNVQQPSTTPSGPKYCSYPGCTLLAKVEKGKQYDHCSKDHAKAASKDAKKQQSFHIIIFLFTNDF